MSKERKPRLAQRLQTDRGLYRALQRWGYYLLALMAWVLSLIHISNISRTPMIVAIVFFVLMIFSHSS